MKKHVESQYCLKMISLFFEKKLNDLKKFFTKKYFTEILLKKIGSFQFFEKSCFFFSDDNPFKEKTFLSPLRKIQ